MSRTSDSPAYLAYWRLFDAQLEVLNKLEDWSLSPEHHYLPEPDWDPEQLYEALDALVKEAERLRSVCHREAKRIQSGHYGPLVWDEESSD